jgi:hypothetical protein
MADIQPESGGFSTINLDAEKNDHGARSEMETTPRAFCRDQARGRERPRMLSGLGMFGGR